VTAPANTRALSDKSYTVLKFIAQILLPAFGTLYFTIGGIWNIPATEQVIGSLTAVDTFLGVILGLSTVSYNRSGAKYGGQINVVQTEGKKVFTLEVEGDPEDIENQKEVTFKINPSK
jgi:hypothetical protein